MALDNDNTVSVIRTSFSYPNMGSSQPQQDDENITHELPSRKGSNHDYIPSVNQSTGSRVNVDPSARSQTSNKGVHNQPMPPKTVTNDTIANETGEEDPRARRANR